MPKKPRRIIKEDVILEQRQLLKIGRSHYISVPKEFLEAHGLKAGDYLPVAANHILKIVPMSEGRVVVEDGVAKVVEEKEESNEKKTTLQG